MDARHTPGAIASLVLFLLFLLYVAGYFVLANHRRTSMGGLIPSYRIADDVCAKVFAPLEWIDRKVRPLQWLPPG